MQERLAVRKQYLACAEQLIQGVLELNAVVDAGFDIDNPLFTIGTVAQLARLHPQTLRQYDRLGVIVPQRTNGGARRYSLRDLHRLMRAHYLSQEESINTAGIMRILKLEEDCRQLQRQVRQLVRHQQQQVFAASADGSIVAVPRSAHAMQWRRQSVVDKQMRALMPLLLTASREEELSLEH